jgi:hypothetical protein
MYGEIYESGNKVGEVHIDPFSYTYSGSNTKVENMLQSWDSSGLNFHRAGVEDGEDSTYQLEDKQRIWNSIQQSFIMSDSAVTIVNE